MRDDRSIMPSLLDAATLPDASDPDAVYTAFVEWAESTGIQLYPAQDEAVIEIVSGNNLILSTDAAPITPHRSRRS